MKPVDLHIWSRYINKTIAWLSKGSLWYKNELVLYTGPEQIPCILLVYSFPLILSEAIHYITCFEKNSFLLHIYPSKEKQKMSDPFQSFLWIFMKIL